MADRRTKNMGNSSFLKEIMGGNELKFRDGALESCNVLCDVAGEVGSDPFLESRFALYGEAALNLCFKEPVRLPQVLNYVYVGGATHDELLIDRPEATERFRLIGLEAGSKVTIEEKTDRTTFAYEKIGALGRSFTIHAHLNWINRIAIGKCENTRIWRPDSNGPADVNLAKAMRCSNLEISVQAAIRSLAQPTPGSLHDLVAAHEFFGSSWDNPLLRQALVWHSMELSRPLTSLSSDRFSQITQRDLDYRLAPFMKGGSAPRLHSLIANARAAIEPLLKLSPSELEYLNSWKAGSYRPELLFSQNPEVLASAVLNPSHLSKFKTIQAS